MHLRSSLPLLLLLAACEGAPVDPSQRSAFATPTAIARLQSEPYSYTYYSGLTEASTRTIRDAGTWATVYGELNAPMSEVPAVPSLNFEDSTLVLVAQGTRNTGGYSILLDSANAEGEVLRIYYTETSPDPASCVVTSAETQPVDLAQVPRWDGPVAFARRTVVQRC